MALIQGPPGTGKHPSQWKQLTHLDTVQQSWLHWFQALQTTPKQRKDLRWWDDGTEWKQYCLRTFVGLKIVQAGLEDRVLRRLLGVWDKEGDVWSEMEVGKKCVAHGSSKHDRLFWTTPGYSDTHRFLWCALQTMPWISLPAELVLQIALQGFWGLQFQPIQQISLWIVCFCTQSWSSLLLFTVASPFTFAFVPLSLDLALQWRLRPGLHHTYRRRRRVMGPFNPSCFDCFPLACPVLASFSTSFSTYAFPFQILCLNGTSSFG